MFHSYSKVQFPEEALAAEALFTQYCGRCASFIIESYFHLIVMLLEKSQGLKLHFIVTVLKFCKCKQGNCWETTRNCEKNYVRRN